MKPLIQSRNHSSLKRVPAREIRIVTVQLSADPQTTAEGAANKAMQNQGDDRTRVLGESVVDVRRTAIVVSAIVLFGLLFGPLPTRANAQLTTAEEKGLPSNSVFSGGDVDVVNLQNGNLHISIPIVSSAQRGGGTVKYALEFDTLAWIKQWSQSSPCNPTCTPPGIYVPAINYNVASNWRLTSPFNWRVQFVNSGLINCGTTQQSYEQLTNWVIIDPEGTQHALPLRQEIGQYSCLGSTLAGPALDGSGLYYDSQAQIIYTKDGTKISVSGTPPVEPSGGPISDRNGNLASSALDTLGRNLLTSTSGTTGSGTPYTTYTTYDSAGSPLVFRVDTQAVTVTSDICSATSGTYNCTDFSQSLYLPSKLTLPTGKTYVFKYANNTPGDLIEMDLPTGAIITYQYEDLYQAKANPHGQSNYVGGRAVTERTVTVNGQSYAWHYTPNGYSNTVTDPLGNDQVHTFSQQSAMANGTVIATSPNVYETGVAYYNSQNQLLKTTATTYTAELDPVNSSASAQVTANVRPIQTTTTLDTSGLTSEEQTDYETFSYSFYQGGQGTATRMNPTETREYDFGSGGPGALLKRTDYAYLHTNNQSYINLNIVDKPTTVTVHDGNGNMAAQTVNEYDNYSHPGQPMQSSGAVQHNASYGTSYTTRGNLTAVSKWRNTDGAFITTTNQYDDAGNVLSTVDPLGHQTQYIFSDSWATNECVPSGTTAAFPTKVINALGQSATTTYNACTGTVASTTDLNGNQTSTTYDAYDRPILITPPRDGGQKSYCYSDDPSGSCYSASALSVIETDVISGSANMVQTTLFDGLGRVQETQLKIGRAHV